MSDIILALIISNILFLAYCVYRFVDKRKVVNKCRAIFNIIRNDEYTTITRRGNHYSISYGKMKDIPDHIHILTQIYPHPQNDIIDDIIDELPVRMN